MTDNAVENSPYLKVLTGLAVLYTLHFAAPILVPLAIAVLLALALAPLVRIQERIGIRAPLGAGLLLGTGLLVLGFGLASVVEPAAEWFDKAPSYVKQVSGKLRGLGAPMEAFRDAQEGVEQLSDMATPAPLDEVATVRVQSPTFLDTALSGTARASATFIAILFFLYFVLASGSRVTNKIARLAEYRVPTREITSLSRELQGEVSRYLLTVSLINLTLGVLTSFWLWWLDVDNPLLWGAVVAVFNFAPYVGAFASAMLLSVVTLVQFDDLSHLLLVVGGFGLLTLIEGQLVTPMVVGRRLELSPYIVFMGIILWGLVVGCTRVTDGCAADGISQDYL